MDGKQVAQVHAMTCNPIFCATRKGSMNEKTVGVFDRFQDIDGSEVREHTRPRQTWNRQTAILAAEDGHRS